MLQAQYLVAFFPIRLLRNRSNIFLVNRYTLWLGEVPRSIVEETGLEEMPGELIVSDGLLTFDKEDRLLVGKYKSYLSRIQGNVGYISRGKEFQLLSQMIDDGYLPFAAHPVAAEDRRKPEVNFTFDGMYSFQKDAYKKFLKLGAIGVYWMTGSGKSFLAMMCLDSIEGKKLIVVPTRTLVDQWKSYLNKYAPRLLRELQDGHIQIVTYAGYEKVKNEKFALVVFDECHRLPANSFSKFATITTRYRVGLSASPKREDGRESYTFALTGFPIGHDWRSLMKVLDKEYHDVKVWIVPSRAAKVAKVVELFNPSKKTLIFADSIDLDQFSVACTVKDQ